MGIEIERKWRLKVLPPVMALPVRITQGYLYIGDDGEVRLRCEGDVYILTGKGKGNMTRPEENYLLLSEMIFNFLWPRRVGGVIAKMRYSLPRDGVLYQFDVHRGYLEGYICVEVEFDSEEKANVFVLPEWVGEALEVTNDKRYKAKYLAKYHHKIREELEL